MHTCQSLLAFKPSNRLPKLRLLFAVEEMLASLLFELNSIWSYHKILSQFPPNTARRCSKYITASRMEARRDPGRTHLIWFALIGQSLGSVPEAEQKRRVVQRGSTWAGLCLSIGIGLGCQGLASFKSSTDSLRHLIVLFETPLCMDWIWPPGVAGFSRTSS